MQLAGPEATRLRETSMEARAKLLGHPVHQMLIVFPVGLLATAVVFDVIHLASDRAELAAVAWWMIVAGLVGGVIAAPFGTIDWLAIPSGTRAKTIGAMHGGGNVVVLALFLASALLRGGPDAPPPVLALVLSFAGAALAGVTAWLGGELVSRLGIGVYRDAGVDAPSSLQHDDKVPVARPR
jgi:uncharacterized membrane protein